MGVQPLFSIPLLKGGITVAEGRGRGIGS